MLSSHSRAAVLNAYRLEVTQRDAIELAEDEYGYLLRACAGTLLRVLLDEEAYARDLRRTGAALVVHAKVLDAMRLEGPQRLVVVHHYAQQTLWLQSWRRQDLAQAQFQEQRRLAYVRCILAPQLMADATIWHRLHVELCRRLLRCDEPEERKAIARLARAEKRPTFLRGQRGDVLRAEAAARTHMEAACAAFHATTALDALELHEQAGSVSLSTISARFMQTEATACHALLGEEAAARLGPLVAGWADCALLRLAALGTAELQRIAEHCGLAAVAYGLKLTMDAEASDRLFTIVAESNHFTAAWEVLWHFRQTEAAQRIQKNTRKMLGRIAFAGKQRDTEAIRATGLDAERAAYEASRLAGMAASFASVVEPMLRAALSCRMRHNQTRQRSHATIGRVAEGYLDRQLLAAERSAQHRNKLAAYADVLLRAAPLLQRVGRAFLVREEVFDVLVEEWEMQEAERQRRNTAGLVIWWAWREFRDARRARLDRALREERRHAAVKIQSLSRGVHCREYYRLVMLPRHWVTTIKRIQKVCRGYQGRKGARKMKGLRMLQCASRGYVSRFEAERRRVYPYACVMQCFWRSFLARRLLARRRMAFLVHSKAKFQAGLVTPIQAAFRGYVQRKRAKVQIAVVRALRREKLDELAATLDDALWCIGRGFLARRAVHAAGVQRQTHARAVQCFLAGAASLRVVAARQRPHLEALRDRVQARAMVKVQAALRWKQAQQTYLDLIDTRQRQAVHGAAMHRLLGPLVEAYSSRRKLGSLWRLLVRAVRKIQALTLRYLAITRKESLREAKQTKLEFENKVGAASIMVEHWKRLQGRRKLSAAKIQRWFLYNALRMRRNREVLNARLVEVKLRLHGALRDEIAQRRFVEQTEDSAFRVAKQRLRAAQLALPDLAAAHVKLVAPPALLCGEDDHRLRLEEVYLLRLHAMRTLEYPTRRAAFDAGVRNARAAGEDRVLRAELLLRSRLRRDEVNTRRLLSLASINRIGRTYDALRLAAIADEATVRSKIDAICDEAFESLLKKYTAWLITAAIAAALAPPEKPSKKTRGLLKPFQNATDVRELKDASSRECDEIFIQRPSITLRAAASAPASLASRPKMLPSLQNEPAAEKVQSILSARSAIPVRSTLSVEQQHCMEQHDQFMVTTTVRKLVTVGDDGVLDTCVLLGQTTTGDALAAPLVEMVAEPMVVVRHLKLSGMTFSDKAFLKVLRYAVDRRRPIESIDLSHNVNITDVTACHLVTAIDAMPTLTAVDLAATSVSVSKRQLITFALERKRAASELGQASTMRAAPVAIAIRRPRPLQIPRRNGWSTTYRLAPIPEPKATKDVPVEEHS